MKTIKELLTSLLEILDEPFVTDCLGFCSFFDHLQYNGWMEVYEIENIEEYLHNEITSLNYSHYPITYQVDSGILRLYYFQPRDWGIRKEWLKEVIDNIKT